MDKYEQRRKNLIELMRLHCNGKPSELARKLNVTDSYLSRMLSEEGKSGKKRIGEDMVERINELFGLAPGDLDASLGRSEIETANERLERAAQQVAEKMQSAPKYAWVSDEEMELITLYRTTDDQDRKEIMNAARASRRLIKAPRIVRH